MKELIIFKIKNVKNGQFAAPHGFVKGQGNSWTTRHGVRFAIVSALLGYSHLINNVSPNDLRIVSLSAKGIKHETVKEFLNVEELGKTKKEYLESKAMREFYSTMRKGKFQTQEERDTAKNIFIKRFMEIHNADWYELV